MISKHCLHILWFQVGELFTPDHRTLGSCLAQLVRCLLMYLSTPYKINITPSTQISMTKSSSLQKCHSIPCCQNDSNSSSGNLLDTDRYPNCITSQLEVEFVHPVTAGGSVKFLPAVKISPFSLIFCVFLTKTVEIR